jgi:hypothetical protein
MKAVNRFLEQKTTKQGTAGEDIARRYLIRNRYLPFVPGFEGSHPIDFITIKPGENNLIAIDAKTYARRFVAEQTGIDAADYFTYKSFEKARKLKVYLMFVDPFEKAIYGAYLSELEAFAIPEKEKVYFPLHAFKLLDWLSPEDLSTLAPIEKPERYRRVKPYFINNAHHVTDC